MNCDYCRGDSDGWVTNLPQKKGKGSAYVINSLFGAKLQIRLPFNKVNEYEICYCPMCGRKLHRKDVE